MKYSHLFSNFSGGALTPKMYGRRDLPNYRASARTLENMVPLVQGSATRRTGTTYVAATKNTTATILIPYIAPNNTFYMLEFGNLYFRIYLNGAQVTSGGSPVQVTTVYTTADLPTLSWDETGSIIVGPNHPPYQVTTTNSTTWAIAAISFIDGPYCDLLDPLYGGKGKNVFMFPGAATGATTMTAASAVFASTDVGRLIRWQTSDALIASNPLLGWGWAIITAFTSSTLVSITIQPSTFHLSDPGMSDGGSSANTSINWTLGAWSATTGYPTTVSRYEGRLIFGGTTYQPNVIWGSTAGQIFNFGPDSDQQSTVTASSSYAFLLSAVTKIQWLSHGIQLLVGSLNGLFTVQGSGFEGISAASPPLVVTIEETPSSDNMPIRLQSSVAYTTLSLTKAVALNYIYLGISSYLFTDISIDADHLLTNGVTQLAYATDPTKLIWGLRTDGTLVSCAYSLTEQAKGWAHHTIGGTNTVVQSIATLSTPTYSQLWLVVQRTINGSTVQFVEVLSQPFFNGVITQPNFLDASTTVTGSGLTQVTGLTYLEGETVGVTVDGTLHPPAVVSNSGVVTLQYAGNTITVGELYTSTLTTLDVDGGNRLGASAGRKSQFNEVDILFLETGGATLQAVTQEVDNVNFNMNIISGQGNPIYSGWITQKVNPGNTYTPYVTISSTGGMPMTISAIAVQTVVSED